MEIIMKRIFYIFYLLVILILIVPGQKKADALSNLENAPRVAAVLPSRDNLFWSDVWASLQKNMPYASFHLTEYDYEISDTSDTKTLLQLLDLVENVSPNGLILAPHVTPSAPLYQKLKALREKGVKIVVLDTDIDAAYYDAFLGIDNTDTGKKMGQYLAANLKPGQEVMEIHNASSLSQAIEDRIDAFYSAVEQEGLSSRIHSLKISTKSPVEMQAILEALKNTKNIRYLVTAGPIHTLYAASALKMEKLSPAVTVLGFGETQEALEYVKQGEIEVLFMQENSQLGQRSVQIMEQLLQGEKTQKRYAIDVNLLTKQNLSYQ